MNEINKEEVKFFYLGKGCMVESLINNINLVLKKQDFYVEMFSKQLLYIWVCSLEEKFGLVVYLVFLGFIKLFGKIIKNQKRVGMRLNFKFINQDINF